MKRIFEALRIWVLLTLFAGVAYPFLVWGFGQLFWKAEAEGSLVKDSEGQVRGSWIVGQKFETARYFWGRPSEAHYDAQSSGGSQWGPTSNHFRTHLEGRWKFLDQMHPETVNGHPPLPLMFGSASGLDPHLSPDAVRYQLNRVARERRLSQKQIHDLNRRIDELAEDEPYRILGEPRINVLKLNLSLDQISSLNY